MDHIVRRHRRLLVLASLGLFLCCARFAQGQAPPGDKARSEVAAKVGEQPVYVKDVKRLLGLLTKNRQVPDQALERLQAETLEQIVRQRLVQIHLKQLGKLASRETLEAELKKQEERLTAQKRKLSDVLAARGVTLPEYRRDLRWELSWKRFAAEEITDEELEAYFERHRPHYDGTQVRASHILLRPLQKENLREVSQTIAQARELREQIEAGEISFADAAKKHSDGPSATSGGDLGFFPRRGVMVDSFARAAFDLEQSDVSQPVVTKFGVHLIQLTDTRPGARTWAQNREQLQTAVANRLFGELAAKQREKTPVQFTGKIAHLDPKTGKLVQAGAQ